MLNRFDATISTISLGSQTQAFVTPLQYDPTPAAIKTGRPILYNTHLNSGLGQVSCGSCHMTNLALSGTATGVAGSNSPALAIDGSTMGYNDQGSVYVAAATPGSNSWWQVDLGTSAQISLIQLFNRWDCCGSNLTDVSIFVSQTPFTSTSITTTRSQSGVQEFFLSDAMGLVGQIPMSTQGRYVRVELNDTVNPVNLAEVRVGGYAVGSLPSRGTRLRQPARPPIFR